MMQPGVQPEMVSAPATDRPLGGGDGTEQSRRAGRKWGRARLTTLTLAFLLIAINPLINFYFHINFVQGWYQSLGVGDLWFVSPLEGLESLLITRELYLPSLIGMLIPLLLALCLGRVFCSWLCPVSFFLELVERARKKITRKRFLYNGLVVAKKVLWFTLIVELLASLVIGAPLFVFLSPPGLVGRELMMLVFFHKLAWEGVVLLLVLGLELFTRRCYCRSFCPLGGLLALIGTRRRLRVVRAEQGCTACKICDLSCPMGLQPSLGEAAGPYCWNCGECVDSCRHGALRFHWRRSEMSRPFFNGSGVANR